MSRQAALLLASALALVACQGPASAGADAGGGGSSADDGNGGTGGTTVTTTSTSTFDCATPDAPPAFEIGTGEKCFERVSDDQEVPLQEGEQGGYHVWLAFGCNDCGTVVHLKYGARDPATHEALFGTSDLEALVVLHGTDWPQAAGMFDYMPGGISAGGEPLQKGDKVLLWAEAYTPKGVLWHQQEIEVVIGDTE